MNSTSQFNVFRSFLFLARDSEGLLRSAIAFFLVQGVGGFLMDISKVIDGVPHFQALGGGNTK